MRLEIKATAWDSLTVVQRKKVCAKPARIALGQPARIDKLCVFDHPALSDADCKAVTALVRSYKPKRKATKKEKE